MIGLDTTAIIDIFRGNPNIKILLEKVSDQIVTSIINYQEVMFGLDYNESRFKDEFVYYDEFFVDVLPLTFTTDSAKKTAEIFWRLHKQGRTVQRFDCMVAGCFISHGINKIITQNVKHFEHIKELNVISY